MQAQTIDISSLEQQAEHVSRTLTALSNPRRLIILCHLLRAGETPVSDLAGICGLSQSALSQHLAVMRQEKLVHARKDGLKVFYAIADPRLEALIASLEQIYCPTDKS